MYGAKSIFNPAPTKLRQQRAIFAEIRPINSDGYTVTFFIKIPDGADVNLDYKPIRDLSHNKPYRAFIESLWARYQPSGDGNKHFLKDASKHFLQRFWEMYLFCALKDHGIAVQKTMGEPRGGPDFSFKIGGTKYWVEATAPGAGNGDDRVPFPVTGVPNYVPRELILLRYANALDEKFTKWLAWRDKYIVNNDDGYIIAINGFGIPDATLGFDYPFIIQSLFPVGPFAVKVDRESLAVSEPYLLYEDTIHKQNGVTVNTAPLIDKKYSAISAVVHSFAGFRIFASPLGYDFLLLLNPCAKHPLPIDSLPWCTQHSFENGKLTRKDPVSQHPLLGEVDIR